MNAPATQGISMHGVYIGKQSTMQCIIHHRRAFIKHATMEPVSSVSYNNQPGLATSTQRRWHVAHDAYGVHEYDGMNTH
jgi:hypothetical protein